METIIRYESHTPSCVAVQIFNVEFLLSYREIVGLSYSGGSFRRNRKFSVTTSKHQSQFGVGPFVDEPVFQNHIRWALKECLLNTFIHLTGHEKLKIEQNG